ncbi:MAG: nucleotidyltransferase domain-containing protein [Candidatus Latescibacteria bacterium]|nr:nucleotidyltransferase domain-containing protein [Candidatus Latescibacterota bacterium]
MNGKAPQITEPLLDEIARKIVDHFSPDKIILFGSHAYGAPRYDSDLDLLVIMDTEMRPAARSSAVARICRPKYVAMDIVVRTPEEIRTRLRNYDPFLEGIFKLGRTLYESAG